MQTFMRHNCAERTSALLIAIMAALITVSAGAAEKTKKEPGEKFFREPEIRTFNFEISKAALNQPRRSPRSYVTGTVREGQHVRLARLP